MGIPAGSANSLMEQHSRASGTPGSALLSWNPRNSSRRFLKSGSSWSSPAGNPKPNQNPGNSACPSPPPTPPTLHSRNSKVASIKKPTNQNKTKQNKLGKTEAEPKFWIEFQSQILGIPTGAVSCSSRASGGVLALPSPEFRGWIRDFLGKGAAGTLPESELGIDPGNLLEKSLWASQQGEGERPRILGFLRESAPHGKAAGILGSSSPFPKFSMDPEPLDGPGKAAGNCLNTEDLGSMGWALHSRNSSLDSSILDS